jgi:hypothetical protein
MAAGKRKGTSVKDCAFKENAGAHRFTAGILD